MARWLGPELLWALAYALAWLLTRLNPSGSDSGNLWMERLSAWLFPALAVPATFVLLFVLWPPAPEQRFSLWLRLWLATCIGLNACLFRLAGAIDHHDSRNAGTWGFVVYGAMAGTLLFALLSAIAWGSWRAGAR